MNEWAIVEVMGHRRYAGQAEEVTVAGAPMLRVNVPTVERTSTVTEWRSPTGDRIDSWDSRATEWWTTRTTRYPGYVVDVGGAALFAITRCPEERARASLAAATYAGPHEPERIDGEWAPRARALLEDAEVVEHEDVGSGSGSGNGP